MRILLVVIMLLPVSLLHANDTKADTTITGVYYGYNLYVMNPVTPEGKYSVTKVLVNGLKTKDQIKSASFEIDFSLIGIEQGNPVSIKLEFHKNFPPTIINTEDLLPPDDFKFVNIMSKRGKLFWRISGRPGRSPFVLEQFRWNRWLKVTEVEVRDTIEAGFYGVDIEAHSGLNIYRIKKIDARGQVVYSKDEKYRSGDQPEVFIVPTKTPNELMFTYETLYEIYTSKGKLIKKGKEKYVDISELPKGKYYVNYDNKTEVFSRR